MIRFSPTKEYNIVSLPILRDLLSKILERNLINLLIIHSRGMRKENMKREKNSKSETSETGVLLPRILKKKSVVIIEERFSTGILFRFAISIGHFLTVTEFQGFSLFLFFL